LNSVRAFQKGRAGQKRLLVAAMTAPTGTLPMASEKVVEPYSSPLLMLLNGTHYPMGYSEALNWIT
jgi:hypothetical protein